MGGWFVLEKWQYRSLFSGSNAEDEFGLCEHWGSSAEQKMRSHRENYIAKEDFEWLAERGINAVRIPIGYWTLRSDPPFVASPDILDRAIQWCEECHLRVLIDLHALPGHQSNEHHTGRRNYFKWPENLQFFSDSLNFVEEVAERYSDRECVCGISLVNEPSPSIPAETLLDFFRRGYERVRRHMTADRVAVLITVFPESRLGELHGKLPPLEFQNVITDLHIYQCFGDWHSNRSIDEHLQQPDRTFQEIAHHLQAAPVIVGEWSLRLPWTGPHGHYFSQTDPIPEIDTLQHAFAQAQLQAYATTAGWFFWNYKAENEPWWCFRECVNRGWLPEKF